MLADLAVDRASDPSFAAQDRWNPDEEEMEEDDGGELNIIDRSASIIVLFRLRSACHATAGIPKECLARCTTGVDVAYPLLASLADLIMSWKPWAE